MPNCEICNKEYKRAGNLRKHMLSHNDDGKLWECKVCHKEYKTEKILKRHEKTHAENKTEYKCEECDKILYNRDSYTRHVRQHNPDNWKKCPIDGCDSICRSNSHLKEHMKTHENKREYKCHLCPKDFNLKGKLDRHLKSHFTDGHKVMDLAKFTPDTKRIILKKSTIVTDDSKVRHICLICGHTPKTKQNLKNHLGKRHITGKISLDIWKPINDIKNKMTDAKKEFEEGYKPDDFEHKFMFKIADEKKITFVDYIGLSAELIDGTFSNVYDNYKQIIAEKNKYTNEKNITYLKVYYDNISSLEL